MSQIKVNSEIGRLKVVLLHEPGEELHNLTPSKLDDLLFDDIPWLPLAKKEHQAFAKTFTDAGVKVVYLTDLMSEVLDLSNEIKNQFIEQFVNEADIHSNTLKEITIEYLKSFNNSKELVLKTLEKLKQEPCENDVIANSLITVANRTLDSAIEIISIIDPYMRIPENWKEDKDDRSELS